MLIVQLNVEMVYMLWAVDNMVMIKLEYLQLVRNSVSLKINGKVYQIFNILELEPLLLYMGSKFIFLEDILGVIKGVGLFNHIVKEIMHGENCLIDYLKESKVF